MADHKKIFSVVGIALIVGAVWIVPEAIDHYRQAIEAQPDYTDAYANLAEAYARVQQPAAAIAAAEKGLELARSQGQTALADRLESSLKSYRSTARSTSTAP